MAKYQTKEAAQKAIVQRDLKILAMETKIKRLREALRPFAKVRIAQDRPGEACVWRNLTVADFRLAKDAYGTDR